MKSTIIFLKAIFSLSILFFTSAIIIWWLFFRGEEWLDALVEYMPMFYVYFLLLIVPASGNAVAIAICYFVSFLPILGCLLIEKNIWFYRIPVYFLLTAHIWDLGHFNSYDYIYILVAVLIDLLTCFKNKRFV